MARSRASKTRSARYLANWDRIPHRGAVTRELLEEAAASIDACPLIKGVRMTSREVGGRQIHFAEDTTHEVAAFKMRGAAYAVEAALRDGATALHAASTGNHGNSVTAIGQSLGLQVTVTVPKGTPAIKVDQMRSRGAEVRIAISESYDEAAADAIAYAKAHGQTFIHPFDDPRVVAGQGTLLLDIVEALGMWPELLVTPVGGGGLAGGLVSMAEQAFDGGLDVVGVEPEERSSLMTALEAGSPVPVPHANSLAQGANVGQIGDLTFPILREQLHSVIAVPEETIAEAMRQLAAFGIRAEGAGALAYASVLDGLDAVDPEGRPAVVIVSGASINEKDQKNPVH